MHKSVSLLTVPYTNCSINWAFQPNQGTRHCRDDGWIHDDPLLSCRFTESNKAALVAHDNKISINQSTEWHIQITCCQITLHKQQKNENVWQCQAWRLPSLVWRTHIDINCWQLALLMVTVNWSSLLLPLSLPAGLAWISYTYTCAFWWGVHLTLQMWDTTNTYMFICIDTTHYLQL